MLVFNSTWCLAQSPKTTLSLGFGFQNYNGDLGNTFFHFDEEWYGVAQVGVQRYVSPSVDVQGTLSIGDYGHCYDWVQDPNNPILDMRSRLTALNLGLIYKFNNEKILSSTARVQPFLGAGIGFNNLRDIWTQYRVNEGSYYSINGICGMGYSITKKIGAKFQMNLGYFTTDKLDYIDQGMNDLFLQNTLSVSIKL